MRLIGKQCTLRSWVKLDAGSLMRYANNINVAKQLRDRFPHPYTRASAIAFLGHAMSTDTAANLAIEVDGEAVGGIGLICGTDVERYSAEVGYWLGEPHWGRGIATEALQLVTNHAFAEMQLLRLFAITLADNVASVRVLEKAGYEREGLLKSSCVKHGTPRDQLLYARVNTDWSC
jgi:ribosomal-protein-alanine N-acetyltransferase